jgi:hypothetical protein
MFSAISYTQEAPEYIIRTRVNILMKESNKYKEGN